MKLARPRRAGRPHLVLLRILLLATALATSVFWETGSGAEAAAPGAQAGTFELHFDSTLQISGPDSVSNHHLRVRMVMNHLPGQSTRYRALGTLRYVEFNWVFDSGECSILLDTQNSSFTVHEAVIAAEQAPITLNYLPGVPTEIVTAVCPEGTASSEHLLWYSSFLFLHQDEFSGTGFMVTDWTFPAGEVYARKTYQRSVPFQEVLLAEDTTIELIGRPETPIIKEISEKGKGPTSSDPETGSPVELWATIDNPDPAAYAIDRCSWTGDLPAPGEGDPNQDCRYEYTPPTGHGPSRQTYGPKDVELTITYRHRESGATGQDRASHNYKVFFAKLKDDLGNGNPNWFDFWRDDGAVPGLDASDIVFDSARSSYGAWSSSSDQIKLGRAAAEVHYPNGLTVPAGEFCPGGSFGGVKGIDSVAEVVAHERIHESLYENWHGGPWIIGTTDDSDDTTPAVKGDAVGDMLPDLEETGAGTNPNDLDSCNLAGIKSPVYSTYGDEEFQAVLGGDGKLGIPANDWANPGKQTEVPFRLAAWMPAAVGGAANAASIYRASKEFPGVAELGGPFASHVTDQDGDGLFDSLVIDVGVEVLTSESFTLVGWLQDGGGSDIAWASYSASLGTGAHTLPLTFDGRILNAQGVDGPYTLAVGELRFGDHEDTADAVSNAHTTSAYTAGQFAPYAAALNGTYDSMTTDLDGDGLYDELQLTVGVEVHEAGTYRVFGQLVKGEMSLTRSEQVLLAEGTHDLVLAFDGAALFHYGEDGPYQLDPVWIEDLAGERLDTDRSYVTPPYQAGQFEHGSVRIERGSYGDQALDLGGDGSYDLLAISFQVTSDRNEMVRVRASLEDAGGGKVASAETLATLAGSPLSPASSPVTLEIDGRQINTHGVDGPYRLVSVTLVSAAGDVLDVHPLAFTTQAYQASEFAAGSDRFVYLPLILSGR